MGMYNEVFKKCPHCKDGVGYLQIHQIVLGFGGFDLDNPFTLEELSVDDLRELRDAVEGKAFYCKEPGNPLGIRASNEQLDVCETNFRLSERPQMENERQRLLYELTGQYDYP